MNNRRKRKKKHHLMCSDKHEYTDRMENWPQKCLKHFSAKVAAEEIRLRARFKSGYPL